MVVPALLLAVFLALPALSATGQLPQLNDLFALGEGEGQEPAKAPVQTNPEPPLVATPRADCVSGGKREPGVQGRVPEGSNPDGFSCNADVIGRAGNSGGFKVHRYVDRAGHECAFYDTALAVPDQRRQAWTGPPAASRCWTCRTRRKPVETARLTEPADALAARVAGAEHQARAAGRGGGQPVDVSRAGVDLRRQPGLPQAGAPVDLARRPSSATRAASPRTAAPSTPPARP